MDVDLKIYHMKSGISVRSWRAYESWVYEDGGEHSIQKEKQEKDHVDQESKRARDVGLNDDYATEWITKLSLES